uniref:Mor transcription activator domain-containing protein n=1 Tax=Candidatus Nitrotoga fabula TaxID=2182327 RepID=A0A2X0SK45_9PROT|nr:conserved protein of unknown function [Candidatus Nitrotoga fabula]
MMEKRDLDIVTVILQRVAEAMPGMSDELVHQVEDEVRREYGGKRLFIPKRSKFRIDEQRKEIFKDGLSSIPTTEITRKHKISRRTLYRLMKTGGRFG